MKLKVVLIPNNDSRNFLLPLPSLLNESQSSFYFTLYDQLQKKLEEHKKLGMIEYLSVCAEKIGTYPSIN